MISHWVATTGLLLTVAAAMALIWPLRKTKARSFHVDLQGPGGAISDMHHGHEHGNGLSSSDF